MKIVVLIIAILFILLSFKIITNRNSKSNTKNQNETTIDLEKDPKTKEYKPKE